MYRFYSYPTLQGTIWPQGDEMTNLGKGDITQTI